jgi:GT2 family glycosyltransferase/glycosyltransferase involved in cell wall biosynthesis
MRILLIVHGYPPAGVGGTEVYAHDLATALATDPAASVFVLTREADPNRPDGDVRREIEGRVTVDRVNNTFRSCTSFEDTYRNSTVLRAAASVVSKCRPDIAHVHHLTCLSTDLVEFLSGQGVPVVLTLHDYWMLCHRGQLFDLDERRCGGPIDGECCRCVPASAGLGGGAYRSAQLLRTLPGASAAIHAASRMVDRLSRAGDIDVTKVRFRHMRDVLSRADVVLAPSQTIAGRFAACGMAHRDVRRWDLGIQFTPVQRAVRDSIFPLRVGFVGSFIPTKAPHLLIEAARMLPAGSVTVDLAGEIASYHGDDSYRTKLAPLLSDPVVSRHGSVPHDRMPEHLSRLDVLVLPSVWLENSPLVIKEAFAAGLPVVTSDLGGMRERVRSEVDGLLFEPGNAHALAAQLRRLRSEPGLFERLRSSITAPAAIEQDAAELRRLYSGLISSPKKRGAAVASPSSHASRVDARAVTAVVLNYRTPDQTWLAVRSLQTSLPPPGSILVIDNGSSDGSADGLRRAFSGPSEASSVTVIGLPENLGFPAGCNVGIESALKAGAEWVFLVNSDVVLAPGTLSELLAEARVRPSAGIFGPLVLSREEPDAIASAGITYSAGSGRMLSPLTGRPASHAPTASFDVTAVSGCAMLIRRAVLEKVGLFDAAYFFFFEDVDLCLRARAAGFETRCVPGARVYHEGGRTIGARSARRVYFATRNHLRLASRLQPRRLMRTITAGSIVGLNTAYVLTSPDAPLLSGLGAVVRGTWHHLLGRYGPDTAA